LGHQGLPECSPPCKGHGSSRFVRFLEEHKKKSSSLFFLLSARLIGKIEDASQKYTAQKKQDAADAAAVRPSTPQTAVSSKTATPTSPLASTGPTTPEVSEASSSGALREVTLPRQFTLPTPLLDVIQCHVIDCVRRGGVNSRFKRQSSTQGLVRTIAAAVFFFLSF